jgi:hypothetical protein
MALADFSFTLNIFLSVKNFASQGPGKYDPDGRFVPTDVLSSVMFCPPDLLSPRTFCPTDVLSLRKFCPYGRFVLTDVLSTDVLSPDVLSGHHRSDDLYWQLKKNLYIFVISGAKPKNFVVFDFTYVSRCPAPFNGDFCMNLYIVDS